MIDTQILELAVKKLTKQLDLLVGECMEDKVTKKTLMKSRSYLPHWCDNTLVKKK